MPNAMKSLVFAVVLCVVCSVLLTAANTGLKSFQQKNAEVDRQKNILKALGIVGEEQSVTNGEVQRLYQDNVKSIWVDDSGRIVPESQHRKTDLPLYLYIKADKVEAYVVPIDSRGLWGKIHGYLAIENDGTTVRGFTVYKHQETPGLGGEIESRWFRKNFKGKKLTAADGHFVSIKIAKGSASNQLPPDKQANYVDGISGATMTGKFLTEGMKEVLKEYEPVAVQFRHNKQSYIRTQ